MSQEPNGNGSRKFVLDARISINTIISLIGALVSVGALIFSGFKLLDTFEEKIYSRFIAVLEAKEQTASLIHDSINKRLSEQREEITVIRNEQNDQAKALARMQGASGKNGGVDK